jgi:hypothetical protein
VLSVIAILIGVGDDDGYDDGHDVVVVVAADVYCHRW